MNINSSKPYPLISKGWKVKFVSDHNLDYNFNYEIIIAPTPNKAKARASQQFYVDYTDIRVKRYRELDLYDYFGVQCTSTEIDYKISRDEYRARMVKFVSQYKDEPCYIYSKEYGLYWRANGNGYTSRKNEAGRYSVEEAWSYTSRCGIEKGIQFILISSGIKS